MDRGHVLRRLVHMSSPIFLVYYWLPEPMWAGGPGRQLGLVFALLVVLVFESIRMTKQLKIIGMRPYESSRMSAAAWAGIALVIAFLFFPFEVAAPAIFGMAWIDPLCGELRKRNSHLYPNLPKVSYFALVAIIITAEIGLSIGVVVAAVLAAQVAISVEKTKTRFLDDDFTMLVIPLIVIAIVLFAFGI
jgi:dolichol kinase